ncbi:ParA family protein [Patescibacteria group bacterium]|nr:ParA family protein [Patescibacteria group bacterium]MBU4056528.1 ParA family protein [Patescibacteria group bacterium]
MNTIAFTHHKGGTGKTTACINVAGWLAKLGNRVLVADLDPQGMGLDAIFFRF